MKIPALVLTVTLALGAAAQASIPPYGGLISTFDVDRTTGTQDRMQLSDADAE